MNDEILPRVVNLEQWRTLTEKRLEHESELNGERHRANLAALEALSVTQRATQTHLTLQDQLAQQRDEKLDKVIETTSTILQRVSHDDGVSEATEKARVDRKDEIRFQKQINAAYGGVLATVFSGVVYILYLIICAHWK